MHDPLQPAVLRLIHEVVEHANAHRIPVSLCGDMASDVRCIPALLDVGPSQFFGRAGLGRLA